MKSGTVAVVGRPNSGKSTLVNALVGQKVSIVSDKPQTTRHDIVGVLHDPRGQIVFVDTPGIHKPAHEMNQRMARAVRAAIEDVDLVLLLIDGAAAFGAGEKFALEMVKAAKPRALLAINKIDRLRKPDLLPIMERYGKAHEFLEIVPISARTGENLDLLVGLLVGHLPSGEARYGPELVTDRTERFLAAELVREKVLERTREELPYATAVLVRSFDERERARAGRVRIEADILVEKASQAGIIVGKGGQLLKEIGTAARLDIERLLDCRVHLSLTVRSARRWRDDDGVLQELELG
jgi:GTP-binding protein Era